MKLKNVFFIVCLNFLSVVLFAQRDIEELVKWNADYKLTWADYKGTPKKEGNTAASTSTYLVIDYNIRNNDMSYNIKSFFSKTRSWGLHKTDYILSHEQGHFDIAEVYARKLHKRMKAYKFNRNTYQKDLDKIYQEVIDEKSELQNTYDRETRHSINKEKQFEWLKKIEKLLEEYEDYADY